MVGHLLMWIAGGIFASTTTASAVLDLLTAISISDIRILHALRIVFFLAFALQLSALGCVAYFCVLTKRLNNSTTKRRQLAQYCIGALYNTVAVAVTCAALIWFTIRQHDLGPKYWGLIASGFAVCALCTLSHITFFAFIFLRIRKTLNTRTSHNTASNATTTQTPTKQIHPPSRSSFGSRDTTLASRACTPTSGRTHSLHSSTTKVASSIRSKARQGRGSAQSSMDVHAFPGVEHRPSSPTAFDRYDTSNIDPDTRNTILCSSPIISRLEPIPGSRSQTPNGTLDQVPAMPDLVRSPRSPRNPSSPSNIGNASDTIPSSPPSTPPNFSRPTSKSQHKPTMTGLQPSHFSTSMTDLIHPLFRPDSPCTPQIMTVGTMVTASPLANQLITPKTLSRLRSDSHLRHRANSAAGSLATATTTARESVGPWRAMPNVDASYAAVMARPRAKSYSSVNKRSPVVESSPEQARPSNKADAAGAGSPGPSIHEDVDLPPILPGFVLSAGSRTSLVGYGKRKSVKKESLDLA